MKTTLADRVKARRKELGYTQKHVAVMTGLTQQSYAAIENGMTLRPRNIARLAEILKMDVAELQFGSQSTKIFNKHIPITQYLPVLSLASASKLCKDIKDIDMREIVEYIPVVENLRDGSFGVRVSDDSMSSFSEPDSFRPGDIVVIEPRRHESGNFVLAYKDGAVESFVRKYIVDAGMPVLKPLNSLYSTIVCDDTVHVAGVVVSFVRQLK